MKKKQKKPAIKRRKKKLSFNRKELATLVKGFEKKISRLNEWRRRLSTILAYGKRAATTKNLDELLNLLVEESKAVLNAERATVFVVDKKKNELWSKVASQSQPIRIPINKGIAGAVATSGKILNIPDVYKDSRFNPEIDKKSGYRTRSCLAAPMINTKNEVIGVFQVLNRINGKSFDKQDEEVLLLLADQTSGDLENAQLYQEIRKVTQETIIRLAATVDAKDHDTRAHLWRMSQYAGLIGQEMGFSREFVENLKMAAPMHDIGKIGVPDRVLNKPGKLDADEWVEMKKHTTYGAEILKGSENVVIQMSAEVALCHHERWDGKGYPNGIKGEEIPIAARISSLADVFDALTSRRIYKPSFSLDDTLNIIKKDTGSHFDPKVVKAFFKALPQITPIMEAYAPRGDKELAKIPSDF